MTKLERQYQEYLNDFDPTPLYPYDPPDTPMDFDCFCLKQEQPEEWGDDGDLMAYSSEEVV